MNFKNSTLAAALIAPIALGAAGQAQAGAYAVSFNHIQNGLILALVDKNDGNGFVVDANVLAFGAPASTSSSNATLNGTGTSSNQGGFAPNADASNGTGSNPVRTDEQVHGGGGTGPTGVSYIMFGDDNGNYATDYSGADANVVSEQTLANNQLTGFEAWAIAESNIANNGFADAGARNASSTALTANVIASEDCNTYTCVISVAFDANPYSHAFLTADTINPPSVARAILDASSTLTKVGDILPTFAWAPNGNVGDGIAGGTETFDAENLNRTTEALFPGQDALHSLSNTFGSYAAQSDGFGPGEYTLNLSMGARTDVTSLTTVPEPSVLSLFGIGLAGIGWLGRRKSYTK